MEELLKTVAEKTGLPADKAQGAIEAVIDFLKEKLPEPIAGQLDKFIGGDGAGGDDDDGAGLGDMLDKGKDLLGGMFGGDK